MILKRTFHPVGHGAFYTERFYDDENTNIANVVFDCGCFERFAKGKKKRDFIKEINTVVDLEFPVLEEKTKIHALFISHFHADHINGIPRLLNNCKVERIIMPKLTDDLLLEVFLYTMLVQGFSAEATYNAINSFVNSVNELKVEVEFDDNVINGEIVLEERNIENVKVNELISTPTIIKVQSLWKYIPFSTKEKKSQLKQFLINGVPEIKAALSAQPIDLEQIAAEFTRRPALIKKCATVYESIFGRKKHNRYSLTLFSGTCDNTVICPKYCHQGVKDLPRYCTKNCIYMGDFEADPNKSLKNTNCQQLLHFYHSYWDKIGIIQVPHHGSHDNMNVNLYKPAKLAVISAGATDINGHPHKVVIDELQKHQCVPLIVTEQETTIQKFTYELKCPYNVII